MPKGKRIVERECVWYDWGLGFAVCLHRLGSDDTGIFLQLGPWHLTVYWER